MRFPALPAVLALSLLAHAGDARAQSGGGYGYGFGEGGFGGYPRVREGIQGDNLGFTFCRLVYRSDRREGGGMGWRTDYPNADRNVMFRTEELTTVQMARHAGGEWAHSLVSPTSKDLYKCPFLFAEDVGTMALTVDEVAALQKFFEKGGTMWVDDFWGTAAWEQWDRQIQRVLPGARWVELTADDPIFKTLYRIEQIPQISSINFWRRSGGGTSERGSDSAVPHIRAIYDDRGRIQVLASWNTDIADGWEREGEDEEYFREFSPDSYAIATNVILWMLTH